MTSIKNTFTVIVQKGNGLRAADLNGKSDPYVIVGWGNDPVKQRRKTPVKNATIQFGTPPLNCKSTVARMEIITSHSGVQEQTGSLTSVLELDVWDKDLIGKDDYLGYATIDIAQLFVTKKPQHDLILTLRPRTDTKKKTAAKIKGTISLSISFPSAMLVDNEEINSLRRVSKFGNDMIAKLVVDYHSIAKEGKISGKAAVMRLARQAHVIDMLIDLSDGEHTNAVDPRLKDKVFSDPALEDVFYGQLLRMFDINHDGEISLEEFVMGLSSLSGGTRAEKAALYFTVNDLNGDGELDRDEVYKMQAGVFAAVKAAFAVGLREGIQELIAPKGPLTRAAFEDLMSTLLPIFDLEEVIQYATGAVFEMQDKDKNGKISKEEFAEWYLDDEQRSKMKQLIEAKATPIIQAKARAIERKLTAALAKYF